MRPAVAPARPRLRRYEGRSRKKLYFFQIVLSEAGEAAGRGRYARTGPRRARSGSPVEWLPQVNMSIQPRIGPGNQEEW